MNTGKGANNIISMLHHFFQTHMQSWRGQPTPACGQLFRPKQKPVHGAVPGLASLGGSQQEDHTIPLGTPSSRQTGLFKQAYRRTKINCLDDIVKVVESSAVVNHAQLVGTQDGKVLAPTYDWAKFFDKPFRQKALTGIKGMHHLTFTSDSPGKVIVKDSVTSPEREIDLLQDKSWKPTSADLPPIIPPP